MGQERLVRRRDVDTKDRRLTAAYSYTSAGYCHTTEADLDAPPRCHGYASMDPRSDGDLQPDSPSELDARPLRNAFHRPARHPLGI